MADLTFGEIEAPAPDLEELAGRYRDLATSLERASSAAQTRAVVQEWDKIRRRTESWDSLTGLRFSQDTTDPDYKRARDRLDELRPKLVELDVGIKRGLLAHPHRAELERELGRQAFELWDADVLTYAPVVEEDMVRESRLEGEYTELLASARLPFDGTEFSLSGIVRYREDPDRARRHEAERVHWMWFAENADKLDRIFDETVSVRAAMARKLGFADFTELGYKRMLRIDYDRADVERFRNSVRDHVVPLAAELLQRQAARLGVDKLMAWDESVHDLQGNPRPQGDHDWMLERAREMFDSMGSGLDGFFRRMKDGGFLDLELRDGKAGGGFCTSFPSYGMPFVFANFNGTKHDVEVFTHEIGHAFQNYSSRGQALFDYLWPTMESCEIHSMSLEFLTWPHMDRFFGDDADRFRETHLTGALLFLPYGVAVDHFQHLVYESPDATPAERHGMWLEMERTYMPWRDWGDLAHPAAGGRWQAQRHIYRSPFYYIDYTLAQTCALQFWLRSLEDSTGALDAWVELCGRGGTKPFQGLVHSAGLTSPFDAGCLEQVVDRARQTLKT